MPFAKERMGFKNPPKLFLRNDSKNAENPLGKTAYYDPNNKSITLYVTGRHPKDVMRSLSHELVHHTQNCNGKFNNVGEMGEGYAQNDEHLREMEREAYETGNMCFRDWEDSLKSTIYYEHLQKGDKKMSTKDWKNKELTQLLSEAWGFKFNSLQEFDEFNGTGEVQEEEVEVKEEAAKPDYIDLDKDGDKEESMKKAAADKKEKEKMDENVEGVFAPNHYCIHHGGVERNGSVELAEAVSHNYDQELGRVTHYDMKFEDGTVMENVPAETIQVTSASLAEGHKHPPGKRDEEELEEGGAAARTGNEEKDQGRDRMHADRVHEAADEDLQETSEEITEEDELTPYTEEQIKEILRKALAIIKETKSNGQEI